MRRLIITENFGQWVAETSSGVRWQSATLVGLLGKLDSRGLDVSEVEVFLDDVFEKITPINASQIVAGQAGA